MLARRPAIPAAANPALTARSSVNAMVLAASLTGCQSASFAPRSTSSTACAVDDERHPEFHDGLGDPAAGAYPGGGRLELLQVAGADGGQRLAAGADHVDHAPCRDVAA